jgi:hypothetical protein
LSNGFSRKYLTLSDVKGVETAVLEKNSDFTASKNDPAAFVITPDLPIKYYYATIKDTSGLHDFRPDDTWTLIGCRS